VSSPQYAEPDNPPTRVSARIAGPQR